MMDDPQTPDECQQAVDLADVLLMIDSARHYGLVTGGSDVDQERCAEILRAGQARGYKPRPDALKRLAPTLFNPLPPEEF